MSEEWNNWAQKENLATTTTEQKVRLTTHAQVCM